MSVADQLIEHELWEMAISPKQQEVLDLIRRHRAPVHTIQARYGRNASREANYEMRWFDQSKGVGLSKRLPTRLVNELIKNKALELVKYDDGYGSWNIVYIPAGDDPVDYGITVWNK